MREIKFRGKDLTNGMWYYGYYIQTKGEHKIITDDGFVFIVPETIGQFTGLIDKNGNEVFVGDIATDGLSLYTVEFSEESCSFVWHIHGSYNTYHFEKTDTEEMEIIGNIHDNPELLSK